MHIFDKAKITTGFYSEQEQVEYKKQNEEIQFKSKFGFLNAHNSFRRGKMHLALAPTGAGKSTFIRSILRDVLFNNPNANIFIWLSEESSQDFKTQISYGMPSSKILENVMIFSEIDNSNFSESEIKEFYSEVLKQGKPDMVLFDNITTSKVYAEKKLSEQKVFSIRLKEAAEKYDHALMIIAHTGAGAIENQAKLIDLNDIRGSKFITTITEFLYIIQPVKCNQTLYQFVMTKKHRGQELVHSLYFLQYDKIFKSFTKDVNYEFKDFLEIYKNRNQIK